MNSWSNCLQHILGSALLGSGFFANTNIISGRQLLFLREKIGHKDMKLYE